MRSARTPKRMTPAMSRRLPSAWVPLLRHSLQTQSASTAVASRSAQKIGNAREHLGPVGTDLIAAAKRPMRMGWLLAVVVLGEQGDERVDVMPVGRLRKRGDDRCGRIVVSGCHGPSLARSQPARNPAVSLLLVPRHRSG